MIRKLIFNIVQNKLTTTNNLVIQSNYAQYHVELVQVPVSQNKCTGIVQ